jgi:hypothetical protein
MTSDERRALWAIEHKLYVLTRVLKIVGAVFFTGLALATAAIPSVIGRADPLVMSMAFALAFSLALIAVGITLGFARTWRLVVSISVVLNILAAVYVLATAMQS